MRHLTRLQLEDKYNELVARERELFLRIKDSELFNELNELVRDLKTNSFCRGLEAGKEIYNN